jgi:shikimate kinase
VSSVNSKPVVLIGYRGCGKSTVGTVLAERLGWEFVDADVEIERRAGRTIRRIFDESGEAEFRRIECEVMADLLRRENVVLAAGGGAVLDERTQRDLNNAGAVVWLRADVETLVERIALDCTTEQRRPDLTVGGGRREVEELVAKRTPIYAACATIVIDSDKLTATEIADRIVSAVAEDG